MVTESTPLLPLSPAVARPRTVARHLLDSLDRELDAMAAEPASFGAPVRVIVSSKPLRRWVLQQLALRRGVALGVQVTTLRGLALDVLEQGSQSRDALFGVLARRAVLEQPELRDALAAFRDGAGTTMGAIRDLLDAGFEPSVLPAIDEWVATARVEQPERVLALLRAAASTHVGLVQCGVERSGDLYRRAALRIRELGPAALPTRVFFVYGFPNATGRALDLLEALPHSAPRRLWVDRPADWGATVEQGQPRPTAGDGFSLRVRETLGCEDPTADGTRDWAAPTLTAFSASGEEAECRELAARVRARIDEGVPAERIAVVARSLDGYDVLLRGALSEIGVPFSAYSPAPARLTPLGRAVASFRELLSAGPRARVETWLGAMVPGQSKIALSDTVAAVPDAADANGSATPPASGPPARATFARWIRARRVVALAELAVLDASDFEAVARVVSGVEVDDEGRHRARGRRLDSSRLQAGLNAAKQAAAALASWPATAAAAAHATATRTLARTLGWLGERTAGPDSPGALLAAAIDAAESALVSPDSAHVEWTREEWSRVLESASEELGAVPLGGAGAGVQVLSALQARGLQFDEVFLLGLNRGAFPRAAPEDPLFVDRTRLALRQAFLADLPVKGEAADEERYLFAHLIDLAPRATLSWVRATDRGGEMTPSVFVERLRLSGQLPEPAALPAGPVSWRAAARDGWDANPDIDPPVALRDLAVAAALRGDRTDAAAIAQGFGLPAAVAAARHALIDEVDPDPTTAVGRARFGALGPFHGLIGQHDALARIRAVSVTHLESHASCGWRYFLERVLRITKPADAVAGLPEVSAAVVGMTVHAALEALAVPPQADALLAGGRMDSVEVDQLRGMSIERPSDQRVDDALRRAAASVTRGEGLTDPLWAEVVVALARPFLDRGVDLIWADERAARTQGAEVKGVASMGSLDVEFRADLVLEVDGRARALDIKTGRPLVTVVTESKRRDKALDALDGGELLQGAAYAAHPAMRSGGYLYVRPDLDPRVATLAFDGDDAEAREQFRAVVDSLANLRQRGLFVPRVEDASGKEPGLCSYCEVAAACVRGDSSHRRRLREPSDRGLNPEVAAAFRRLWQRHYGMPREVEA